MVENINNAAPKTYDTSSRGCCVKPDMEGKAKVNQMKCCKLSSFDWLKDYENPTGEKAERFVEIRFKNDHKEFFKNPPDLLLNEGDIVAVEATSGHDIGIVSLTGDAVMLQMKRKRVNPEKTELKQVYRYARYSDIENWFQAMEMENKTIFASREIAMNLGLNFRATKPRLSFTIQPTTELTFVSL